MNNILCVSYKDKISLIYDKKPEFDIVVFDYGSNVPYDQYYDIKFDVNTECKGDLFVQGIDTILNTYGKFDRMCFFDDDIVIKISMIETLFELAKDHKLDLFQPSLSHDSYYSHKFTLTQGKGMRNIDWVEVMMPGFSYEFTTKLHEQLKILDLKYNIKSGWGIDKYTFPHILNSMDGTCMISDDIVASHINPVASKNRIFSNGKNAHQELELIKRHYS